MTESEARLLRESVAAWGRAGPELERIRRAELRQMDTVRTIQAFSGMVLVTLRERGERTSSGLVEQQMWFRQIADQAGA
ncbi:MAG: hypothetical protein SGI84_05345 [Gemmatimonadota bacterium]|nr:hypothetical protein [Gemmatimonadota bacterium]